VVRPKAPAAARSAAAVAAKDANVPPTPSAATAPACPKKVRRLTDRPACRMMGGRKKTKKEAWSNVRRASVSAGGTRAAARAARRATDSASPVSAAAMPSPT